ncbi:MAG TPA: hypothetical protein VK638_46605 [Edaphobacter sp.]|nr:hypothetical protein [Edaphobacter sp.]
MTNIEPHCSAARAKDASSKQPKAAIVTGASSGIGLEIAKSYRQMVTASSQILDILHTR